MSTKHDSWNIQDGLNDRIGRTLMRQQHERELAEMLYLAEYGN